MNSGDSELRARQAATEVGLQNLVLLDSDWAVSDGYLRPIDAAYASFPMHVLVDTDGTIRYLRSQWDIEAARAAIDQVLQELTE